MPPPAAAGARRRGGSFCHRYRLEADGTIAEAKIVPPTSQNQRPSRPTCAPLGATSRSTTTLRRCEQAIRNHDPCISCATHFLDLRSSAAERVVIGVGNDWRGDDAAGLPSPAALPDAPAGVRVVRRRPGALLDAWADAARGDRDRRRPLGCAARHDPSARPVAGGRCGPGRGAGSTHGLGVTEAVELARALDRLPERLELYGIEAAGATFDPDHTVAMICGPEVMMRFAVAALQERGVRRRAIHVSLERSMKCAIRLCGHCQLGPEFICQDGPVFTWDRVEPLLRVREL